MITMWQDILKINMEEARRLGNTYSPDDMGKAVDVSMDSIFKDVIEEIAYLVKEGEDSLANQEQKMQQVETILKEFRRRLVTYLRSD